MKQLSLAAFLASTILNPLFLHAQGSLTPPGAPAPTMKTLSQLEPRTPISSVPFTITKPGSYYLTTNLTCTVSNAIIITTSDVTLDLGGFTIFSTVANAANGGTAVLLGSGLSDITVANGHIRSGVTNNGSGVYSGSGFANGIGYDVSGNGPVNVLVSCVSVFGCLDSGIFLTEGDSVVVESCTVRTVGSYGIYASTIKESIAIDCGNFAIDGDQVSGCWGQSSGSGVGVGGYSVQNCEGWSVSGNGISANTALNYYGVSNGTGSTGNGVQVYTAENCDGFSYSGTGVDAGFVAIGCIGFTQSGGTGLSAGVANSCYSSTGDSRISNKYNMP
jgi:hypothetical protein